jgi:hypothetical protein
VDEAMKGPTRIAALGLLLASCSYYSEYVPPADGMARVVWRGDPVALVPRLGDACSDVVHRVARAPSEPSPTSPPCADDGAGCGGSVWFDHAQIVEIDAPLPHLVHRGPAVHFYPLDVSAHPAMPAVPLHEGLPVPGPVHAAAPAPSKGSIPVSAGGSKGGLGGIGGGGKELLVGIAVIALVTMPLVAIALATTSPEDLDKSAGAIDLVNAFNDVVRTPGNACTEPAALPPVEAPAGFPPPPGDAPRTPAPAEVVP